MKSIIQLRGKPELPESENKGKLFDVRSTGFHRIRTCFAVTRKQLAFVTQQSVPGAIHVFLKVAVHDIGNIFRPSNRGSYCETKSCAKEITQRALSRQQQPYKSTRAG